MNGFEVEPEVLARFAETSDGRAESLTTIGETLTEIRLAPDAFGHIPFLGSTVYDAYDDHVAGCEEAVASAQEAMSVVADGLRTMADAYVDCDRAAEEQLAGLLAALDQVPWGRGES